MLSSLRFVIAWIAAIVVMNAAAVADAPAPDVHSSEISGPVLSGASGVLSVNVTAGNGNAQANVVALGRSAHAAVRQDTIAASAQSGSARIDGFAFSGSAGILQVNQSAGTGNAQANVVVVGDDALATAMPQQTAPQFTTAGGVRAASIDKTAFAGSRGLVQVSQVAGSANRTSNTFLLQLQGVAGH